MIDRTGFTGFSIGIYVRESRDDNEENYETIETQRELLVDYVRRNNLGRIFRIYEDDNVSGSGFERKGISRLKEDVAAGNIDFLLIKDLSRLGRNNAKTLLFLDFLEEFGVRVVTSDGRYDSSRDNDTVGIDTWYNERYIRDVSRKIRANLRFKIERGEYIGHAPYGYVKSIEQKNRLCIDPVTAPVVREIFRLYRGGYGYAFIAKLLDSKGYPPPVQRYRNNGQGNGWNPISVRRILFNRVYIGDTIQGVSQKVSFKSKKTRRLPSDRWVITEGTHEALIGREEFEEVLRIRSGRNVNTGPHKGEVHLLKGLAYCGRCGSMMIARSRADRPIGYICGSYNSGGRSACSSHHLNENTAVEILAGELQKLLSDKKAEKDAAVLLEEEYLQNDRLDEEVSVLEKQISLKQRQQDALYMDKLEGRISEQLFTRTNTSLESKISMLMCEMERLKSKKKDAISGEELIRQTLQRFVRENLTHEIVKIMVERIVVYDAGDDLSCLGLESSRLEQARRKGAILVELRW